MDFWDLVLHQKLFPYSLLQLRIPLDSIHCSFKLAFYISTRAASLHQVTPVCPGVVPEPAIIHCPTISGKFFSHLGSARGSMGLFPGGTAVALNRRRVDSSICVRDRISATICFPFKEQQIKAHPHNVRIVENQVVKLTRILSDVEEANLNK